MSVLWHAGTHNITETVPPVLPKVFNILNYIHRSTTSSICYKVFIHISRRLTHLHHLPYHCNSRQCVCVCVCVHVRVCVFSCVHVCMQACVCMTDEYLCVCTYVYSCTYSNIDVCHLIAYSDYCILVHNFTTERFGSMWRKLNF